MDDSSEGIGRRTRRKTLLIGGLIVVIGVLVAAVVLVSSDGARSYEDIPLIEFDTTSAPGQITQDRE